MMKRLHCVEQVSHLEDQESYDDDDDDDNDDDDIDGVNYNDGMTKMKMFFK